MTLRIGISTIIPKDLLAVIFALLSPFAKITFMILCRLGKAQTSLALLSPFAKIRPLRGKLIN